MIDYVKLLIKDTAISKHLLSNLNELFDTHSSTVTTTVDSEITNVYAAYKGLRFKIKQTGAIIIDGSLHKAMNDGKHNHNNFSYDDLLRCIDDLCQRFNLDARHMIVQNLEIGINVNTPFDPVEFTDRCPFLFTDAGVIKPSPITKHDLNGFKKGIRFDLSEYGVKIYNKGAQYSQVKNILRVEYKTYKTRAIEKVGIETLFDLCDIDKLKLLVEAYLFPKFDGLMVDEIVDERELNTVERRHYNRRLDFNLFWDKVSRTQRGLNKGYISRIYSKYAQSDFKSTVGRLMRFKANQLLSITKESKELFHSIANTNYVHYHTLYKRWDRTKLAA